MIIFQPTDWFFKALYNLTHHFGFRFQVGIPWSKTLFINT